MIRTLLLSLCVAALIAGQSLHADILLSNLPGTSSGSGTNLGVGTDLADRTKAVGLTMGSTAFVFDSLEALISNTTPGSVLSGGIFSDDGGNPGSLITAFNPVDIGEDFGPSEVSLTTDSPFTLDANTSYWFVLDGPDTSNSLLWNTLNPNVAPTPNGVTFDGYRFSSDGGANWGSSGLFNGVRINGTVVPEPATTGLVMVALGGAALVRRRRK